MPARRMKRMNDADGRKPVEAPRALSIRLKRAYDSPSPRDGARVLVDRLWPRGVKKEQLKLDAWLRDLGPRTALRQWFGHDPEKWEEFRRRYRQELAGKRALLSQLAAHARGGTLTLVYGARDPVHNQAAVIKEVLEAEMREAGARRSDPWPMGNPSRAHKRPVTKARARR
jgi:uncharacterized protein YeaO (DUF488 family)